VLEVTNSLSYYGTESFSAVKSFMVEATFMAREAAQEGRLATC